MLIVQKYGGSSVSRGLQGIAARVMAEVNIGNQIVVVVSAFTNATNELLAAAASIVGRPINYAALDAEICAEVDVIAASGEQNVAAITAIALMNAGVRARSFLGWQCPIYTDDNYGAARIERIDSCVLKRCLAEGIVPVIAGFQGINRDARIVTLGRGGSDYTATAVAVALNADRCDIFTDVDGVYSADPSVAKGPKLLKSISFAEMLEFASGGAKVLQRESLAIAMAHNLDVRVLAHNEEFVEHGDRGTNVSGSYKAQKDVTGITTEGVCLISINAIDDPAALIMNLSTKLFVFEMLSIDQQRCCCSFVVKRNFGACAIAVLEDILASSPGVTISVDSSLTKISLIGVGFGADSVGRSSLVARTLAKVHEMSHAISAFKLVSISELRFSFLVDELQYVAIVKALLDEFGLGQVADGHSVISCDFGSR